MGLKNVLSNFLKTKKYEIKTSIPGFGKYFYLLMKDLKKPAYRSFIIKTLQGKEQVEGVLVDKNHSSFGSLSKYRYEEIKKMLFFLLDNKCLTVHRHGKRDVIYADAIQLEMILNLDYSSFKDFKVPDDEISYLEQIAVKKEGKIENTIPKEKRKTKRSIKNVFSEEDRIYSELSKLRLNLAKEKKVSAFVIMYNQTLEEIIKTNPSNEEEFLRIKFITKKKYDEYGYLFLEKLLEIKNEKDLQHNQIVINDSSNINSHEEFVSRNKYCELNSETISLDKLNLDKELLLKLEKENNQFVNAKLISEKNYLDNLLKEIDENIVLDDKQREAILRDEDYTLIVAGAGSGKTTTVAAKTKYLVEKLGIDPKEILIVSFTNDAVEELKERINKNLKIPAIISTFHKIGYSIIRKQKDSEKMQIAHEGIIFNVIRNYLKDLLKNRVEDLRSMILFFGYYIDAPLGVDSLDGILSHFQRNDYTTLKENLADITDKLIKDKEKKRITIRHEVMRSLEEVQIANFLYLHSVDYSYEEPYPYHIKESKKLYTPDFTIKHHNKKVYLEHFGISESGTNNRYTSEELATYKEHINEKVLLHKEKGTELIFTFSQYNDDKSLLEHLKENLIEVGIDLVEKSTEEIYQKIIDDEENKYFTKLIFLIKDFIASFKINGYSEKDFSELYDRTNNVRNRLFLKIVKPIYMHYQSFLHENDMIDFEDMINESSRILSNPSTKDLIPNFKYIFVDEYQDISMQRFDLTKALSSLTNAKIIAVGDDWQSIFAFAGSRVDLFIKFKDLFGYADYLTIDYTYRNAQQLIDTAGKFIQENSNQLKKNLKSSKNIDFPVILYEYNDLVYKNESKGYKGILYEKAKLCDEIFKELVEEFGDTQTIALLGRYNFEIERLATTDFFEISNNGSIKSINYPKLKLKFMTIHASKGLGFDNVIILNGSDEVFGFPSQIEMDPILKLVKYDDKTIAYAEERRLFYVALTRTKNKVYLLYPKTKPSYFVKELTKGYSTVRYPKSINQNIPLQDRKDKRCPICGYPLQFKNNKAYGLKLYMCTNEPELCGYLTNNLRSGLKSVSKCPDCKTGFLVVKNSRKTGKYFFGCTNYKDNGQGCNHVETI